jgi:DNA-binding CsgD family transcriptional regulator
MREAIFLFYMMSICVSFAGLGVCVFLLRFPDPEPLTWYIPLLGVSIVLVLAKDSAFFIASYQGFAGFADGGIYFLARALSVAAFSFVYARFVPRTLGVNPRAAWERAFSTVLYVLPALPLGLIAAYGALGLPQAAPGILFDCVDACFALTLLLAVPLYLANYRHGADAICGSMMRFTGIGTIAYLPLFLAACFLDRWVGFAYRPISSENLMLLFVSAGNLFLLSPNVFFESGKEGSKAVASGQAQTLEGRLETRSELRPETGSDPRAPSLAGAPEGDRGRSKRLERAADLASLFSPRERQVLSLLERGLGNKQIAAELGLKEETVRNHIYHMSKQVGARNRIDLIARVRG